jgi:hypothetical protein
MSISYSAKDEEAGKELEVVEFDEMVVKGYTSDEGQGQKQSEGEFQFKPRVFAPVPRRITRDTLIDSIPDSEEQHRTTKKAHSNGSISSMKKDIISLVHKDRAHHYSKSYDGYQDIATITIDFIMDHLPIIVMIFAICVITILFQKW